MPPYPCCHQHSTSFISFLCGVPLVNKSTGCELVSQLSDFLAVSLCKLLHLPAAVSSLETGMLSVPSHRVVGLENA